MHFICPCTIFQGLGISSSLLIVLYKVGDLEAVFCLGLPSDFDLLVHLCFPCKYSCGNWFF